MRPVLAVLAFAVVSASTMAETLSYEVYELTNDGSRKLLVSDTRTYAANKDIRVKDIRGTDGNHLWSKQLPLAKGFHVDVAVTREASIDGFGLTFGNEHWPMNFSWNWFEEEQADNHVFKQLKSDGIVRVTTSKTAGRDETEEIVAVEFLTDVTLTCADNMLKMDPRNPKATHAIVVKKGGVLRVAE